MSPKTTSTNKGADKAPFYSGAEIKKLPHSRVEIIATVPASNWESFRAQALKEINESITLDGFRKGNVPESILVAKVGENVIREETAEMAISKAYIEILIDKKIDAIGKPEVQVTKLAAGNPLEFTATTAIVPELTLGDYKKIASDTIKKIESENKKSGTDPLAVNEKELEEAITRVRKSRASHEGHDHEKMTHEEHEKAIEAAMPELTDDFVRSLGDFKDIPDFKTKLSAMITEDKKDRAREKIRISISDALADASTVDLPAVMVESELGRTQAQFEADIERMGVKMDDYLKHAKKTITEIREEWRPHAEKKAKLQMILNKIAVAEDIKPDQSEIDEEVSHIIEHYQDADRERAAVYAETVLTNEKVYAWLEGQK